MKAREMERVYVLRGIITAVKNLKVEKRGEAVGEAEIVQIVRKEIRKREEAEEFATKAGRNDLLEQNRAERAMLEAYVPAQLDAAQRRQQSRAAAGTPTVVARLDQGSLKERFVDATTGSRRRLARRVLSESQGYAASMDSRIAGQDELADLRTSATKLRRSADAAAHGDLSGSRVRGGENRRTRPLPIVQLRDSRELSDLQLSSIRPTWSRMGAV